MTSEMNASDFKARCLAVLDEVARSGEPVTILKRGKAVAMLVPAVGRSQEYPQQDLAGTVTVVGDIVSPVVAPREWAAVAEGEIPEDGRKRRKGRGR
jgi:prevent-host-death family protein